MLINNSNNGDNDLIELQQAKIKLEEAAKSKETAALKKLIEPLTEAIEELTEVIQEVKEAEKTRLEPSEPQEYFDKDLNKNLTSSIDKVFGLLQNIKQPKLDLSPITSIATEIRSQNSSLISLIQNLASQSNKSGYETLVREVISMIQKSNDFISRGIQLADYSKVLEKINLAIENNKATEWEFKSMPRDKYGILITTAIPKLKK